MIIFLNAQRAWSKSVHIRFFATILREPQLQKKRKKKCALNCNPGCSLFFGKKENPRTTCMKNRARSSSLLRRHILVCRWNRLTSWSPVMLFVKVLTLWHVGGKQNLVALVCLFFFFFLLHFLHPADPLYSLRQGSTPSVGCHGYKVSLALVNLKRVFL